MPSLGLGMLVTIKSSLMTKTVVIDPEPVSCRVSFSSFTYCTRFDLAQSLANELLSHIPPASLSMLGNLLT